MTTLLGQKSITFLGGTYTYDVVFGASEFSAATGFATLSGPLSLSLDLINQTNSVWYVGIIIERDIGTISIADRTHIAAIDILSNASISPSSVPQLARIEGNITKITVRVGVFQSVFYTPAGTSTVSLRFDPPVPLVAQPIYIGKDYKLLEPAIQKGYDRATNVVASTLATTVVDTGVIAAPWRFRVKQIIMILYPTPSYSGDLRGFARITPYTGGTHQLFDFFSEQLTYARFAIDATFLLNVGDRLILYCDNLNSAVDYLARGTIFGEYIY